MPQRPNQDPSACWIRDAAKVTDGLVDAVARGKANAGSENVLAFDGLVGGFHVSESLAADLREAAPRVIRDVADVRLPKWLAQRGLPATPLM